MKMHNAYYIMQDEQIIIVTISIRDLRLTKCNKDHVIKIIDSIFCILKIELEFWKLILINFIGHTYLETSNFFEKNVIILW